MAARPGIRAAGKKSFFFVCVFSFFFFESPSFSFSFYPVLSMARVRPSFDGSQGKKKNEREGKEGGVVFFFLLPCSFFSFFLFAAGKKQKLTPYSLPHPPPPLQTRPPKRPCSAAAPPSSSTVSACSLRGPRRRGSLSSTRGSRKLYGTSTGRESMKKKSLSRFCRLLSLLPSLSRYSCASSSISLQHLPAALVLSLGTEYSKFKQQTNATNSTYFPGFFFPLGVAAARRRSLRFEQLLSTLASLRTTLQPLITPPPSSAVFCLSSVCFRAASTTQTHTRTHTTKQNKQQNRCSSARGQASSSTASASCRSAPSKPASSSRRVTCAGRSVTSLASRRERRALVGRANGVFVFVEF